MIGFVLASTQCIKTNNYAKQKWKQKEKRWKNKIKIN